MSKKYAQILIRGKRVQKVMFRDYIRELAVKYGLFGEVHNVNNYPRDVMVLCEGEERNIKNFIHELKALKGEAKLEKKKKAVISESEKMLIQIDEVDASFHEHKGIFNDFTIIRSAEEAGERFAEGGQQIAELRAENKINFNSLDKKYGAVSKTLNSMNQKLGGMDKKLAKLDTLEDIKGLLEKFVNK